MSDINAAYFCTLSTHPQMLSWLSSSAPDLHAELVIHLKGMHGCSANAGKMLWVLGELGKRDGMMAALRTMLAAKFPQALAAPGQAPARPATHPLLGQRRIPVFGHYDPSLLTIPMRAVLGSEEEARAFLAGKPAGEYVMVGGQAYVEYLTPEMAGLASQIPAANWLVRAWRARQS